MFNKKEIKEIKALMLKTAQNQKDLDNLLIQQRKDLNEMDDIVKLHTKSFLEIAKWQEIINEDIEYLNKSTVKCN